MAPNILIAIIVVGAVVLLFSLFAVGFLMSGIKAEK